MPQAARPCRKEPAGGHRFSAAVKLQLQNVTIHGILAAHEIKKWIVSHNYHMTLGTAGTERHWRNWQRMARNLGRSHGDAKSVYLVSFQRWLREVQARSTAVRVDPASRALIHTRSTQLATALLHGDRPVDLAAAGEPISVYTLFLEGKL